MPKKPCRSSNLILSGDGLLQNLYHLLWAKDTTQLSELDIRLPDTVVYSYEQPQFWYFTSKTGEILRKSKKNFTLAAIE